MMPAIPRRRRAAAARRPRPAASSDRRHRRGAGAAARRPPAGGAPWGRAAAALGRPPPPFSLRRKSTSSWNLRSCSRQPPVLELELLDLAGHLAQLVLQPRGADQQIGGILRRSRHGATGERSGESPTRPAPGGRDGGLEENEASLKPVSVHVARSIYTISAPRPKYEHFHGGPDRRARLEQRCANAQRTTGALPATLPYIDEAGLPGACETCIPRAHTTP